MPSSETRWFCDKCRQAYPTEQQAAGCEVAHYDLIGVIGIEYEPMKKCPKTIQVQISVGDDIKEVLFKVVDDSWGSK